MVPLNSIIKVACLLILCRRLRVLATENSLPETELADSVLPLRVAKLQPEDEQEFLYTAATLDLRRETTSNPIGYLVRVMNSIVTGERRRVYAVNTRCTPASEPGSMHSPDGGIRTPNWIWWCANMWYGIQLLVTSAA